ncbi:hypothetical protein [Nostoc sp.]|uniref:hypothetical protein n=1 Tax=Nostoc sp. TaxID=1180 RepID=UPI002FFC9C5A
MPLCLKHRLLELTLDIICDNGNGNYQDWGLGIRHWALGIGHWALEKRDFQVLL